MCCEQKPMMIFCTESRLTDDIRKNEYEINGYNSVVCLSQSRYTGGVIIYIKNSLKFKEIANESIDKIIWCLSIELFDCSINGIYSVVYRSPAFNLNTSNEFLDSYIEKYHNLNKMCIIVGDMNIDLNMQNNYNNQLMELISKYDFKQIVDFNTRITNESETLIDYVITNRVERVTCKPIKHGRISDHETIEINISKTHSEIITNKYVMSWSNYNKHTLVNNLRNCVWSNNETMNIERKVETLNDNIVASVTPMINYVMINSDSKPKKWFDNELKELKRNKIAKYNFWSLNKCDAQWNEYIDVRNLYNRQIKFKKNKCTQNQIVKAGKNQKLIWRCLNLLISDKNYKPSEEILFDEGPCSDPELICENFNEFFVESIISLNSNIPHSYLHDTQVDDHNEMNIQFKFRPTDVEEVTNTLRYLTKKMNKSEICNSRVWLDAAGYCGYFLADIINESMSTGHFPTAWKTSTVVPIPKIRNSRKAVDHRGINMLPNDEKVCEIIIKNQLVEYIETNMLLSQYQSAFRSNHSCESTINYVINDWKTTLEDGLYVVAVFLDLKRAFETVDRAQMTLKLHEIGVRGVELKWFESYLDSRKQQTKFNGKMSKKIDVPIGLPQGTALSVILFILYIDNITKTTRYGSIVLFADDTVLIVKDKNIETAIRKTNEDLNNIVQWLNSKKLMLNAKKTQWMLISRTEPNRPTPLVKIGNDVIEKVRNVKYLGIVIDDKLGFKTQAMNCIQKSASKTNLLYRISRKITFDTKKLIYDTLIRPQFQYCSTIYIMCNKEEIEKMQKIQNRAMRTILNCEYLTPIEFMLGALNWLSITQMIKLDVVIYIHKMLNGLLPNYLTANLVLNRDFHNRNTRQNNNNLLRLPSYRLQMTRKSIFYNGVVMYNSLPCDIRLQPSIQLFKRKCKEFLLLNNGIP